MVKFFRIKEKARGLARQQKYDQALAEYRAAIAQAETESDVSALRNLYNAAGDAALEKNDAGTAIEYFEKASDSYAEEGLYDNAIALCHKILRHVPTRVEVYARLGRVYAEKGLRNESLQNWLEYAERRQKAGDLQGVIRALREVMALSPESDTIREQLAEVLLSQREGRGALVEFDELRRRAELAGDGARLAELSARIAAIRGEYGIEQPAEVPAPGPDLAAEKEPAAPAADAVGEPGMERFEPLEGLPSPVSEAGSVPAGSLPGLDSGFGFSGEGAVLAPPGEAASVGPPEKEPAGRIPEAKVTPALVGAERGAPREPAGAEAVPPLESLPGFTLPSAGEPTRPDVARMAYVPVHERIARAEARLAEDPADAEERIYLAELYQEQGVLDLARAAMEQGAWELFQSGQLEKAYRAYRRLAALVPEIEVVQKLVDVAQAAGSREQLLQSYELLGDRLMEAGQYGPAAEIHRRILEMDPGHRHSHDQLLILEGLDAPAPAAAADRARPAAAARSEEEYVDLASLIAEGETPQVAQPRMVARARPTGDEQADLDAVIDAFRRGVAENIEEGDSESHYDLGVAFREMGLLDEAVREFQLAARGAQHRERAFELMGLCFMEKGMVSVAANCFRRGLEGERDPHAALGLHYHLGRSLEELGNPAGARDEYEKVVALDVQFMDVAERLKRLG
jgi:tetratricopeptide (TPR) repeat protein